MTRGDRVSASATLMLPTTVWDTNYVVINAYAQSVAVAAADMIAQGMRVGASHDPPWLQVGADGTVSGPEAELMQGFADAQGYRLTWLPGSHDALMRDLQDARLHAVVGGHHPDSPWKPMVGWSQPLALRASADGPMPERRIALPPGQSAWHLAFDRYLAERENAP